MNVSTGQKGGYANSAKLTIAGPRESVAKSLSSYQPTISHLTSAEVA